MRNHSFHSFAILVSLIFLLVIHLFDIALLASVIFLAIFIVSVYLSRHFALEGLREMVEDVSDSANNFIDAQKAKIADLEAELRAARAVRAGEQVAPTAPAKKSRAARKPFVARLAE